LCEGDSVCAPEGLYPGPCVEEHRAGLDDALRQRSVYTWDDRCLLVRAEHDFDGDGLVDLSMSYTHDERRLLIRESRVHDPDGTEVWTYSYDESGNQVLVQWDREDDGVIDYRVEYDRNERGDVLEERAYTGDDLSGWTVTTYDGEGGVVTVEEHQHFCIDWTVFTGETVSRRTTYTNDGAGRVTVEVDGVECLIADGVIDVRTERIFDESGNLMVNNVDGTAVTPGPPDGLLDACTRYSYDEHGWLVRIEWDGGGGLPSGGHALCDGSVDSISVRVHDDEGREVRIENDTDADGVADEVLSYEYDPCGNRTEWSSWRESEDRTVWTHTFGYDCWE
ncbi:MAG: hypothetical protein JRG91_12525, partial [Deltaproteobacteria bacterium]|nr:hypothetical protein [Deltaproteobacteria bacterium]